jgi:hypothetical protein
MSDAPFTDIETTAMHGSLMNDALRDLTVLPMSLRDFCFEVPPLLN